MKKISFLKLRELLPGLKKNISLKNYTTFRIGGKAEYFFTARIKEDLFSAVAMAKKLNLPFFILGGGSNLLVSDKGCKGLVIKMQNAKIKMQNENSKCKIICDSGTSLASVVSEATKNNLSGLEWASGIPGTVGGAVFGNAGAFQKSMEDVVEEIEVLDIKKLKTELPRSGSEGGKEDLSSLTFKNKDCKFGYRDSIFKRRKNLIILSAVFQLKKGNKKEIQKRTKEYLNYKKETQPLNYPSAGSVFKNSPGFSAGELGEENKSSSSSFAAAWLIEKCSLKGKKIGRARISEKHANFIVNLGGARAEDVKKLINLAKKSVKNKFKINLEEEIQFL